MPDSTISDSPLPGLYIVATPIGNLGDISARAAAALARADVIAAEDTRVTAKLLAHLGLRISMTPYHDHSDERARAALVARMAGEVVVLVSDAGTPLISDPGYKLVRDARAAGRHVTTLPGPCAAIAAITLSGLPSDRFLFAGFLPSKAKARAGTIAEFAGLRATLVFYESGPRLSASLAALADGLGDRDAAVAREITKIYEQCVTGTLSELAARYADAPPRARSSSSSRRPATPSPKVPTTRRSTPRCARRWPTSRSPRPRRRSPNASASIATKSTRARLR